MSGPESTKIFSYNRRSSSNLRRPFVLSRRRPEDKGTVVEVTGQRPFPYLLPLTVLSRSPRVPLPFLLYVSSFPSASVLVHVPVSSRITFFMAFSVLSFLLSLSFSPLYVLFLPFPYLPLQDPTLKTAFLVDVYT